jgi:hypothetical protein
MRVALIVVAREMLSLNPAIWEAIAGTDLDPIDRADMGHSNAAPLQIL